MHTWSDNMLIHYHGRQVMFLYRTCHVKPRAKHVFMELKLHHVVMMLTNYLNFSNSYLMWHFYSIYYVFSLLCYHCEVIISDNYNNGICYINNQGSFKFPDKFNCVPTWYMYYPGSPLVVNMHTYELKLLLVTTVYIM